MAAAPAAAAAAAAEAPADVGQLLRSFQRVQGARAAAYARLAAGFRALMATRREAPYQQLLRDLTGEFASLSQEVLRLEAQLSMDHPDEAALLRRVQEGERSKLRWTLTLQALRHAEGANAFSWQQGGGGAAVASDASFLDVPAGGGGGCAAAAANGHGAPQAPVQGQAPAGAPPPPPSGGAPPDAAVPTNGGDARGIDTHAATAVLARHRCQSHAQHHGRAHHGNAQEGDGGTGGAGEPSEEDFVGAVAEATQLLDTAVMAINDALEEVRYALEEAEG